MDTSTTSSSTLRSMLADEAMAESLVPWACPCDFGRGGRYRLEELIGMGRRSFVYRARDSHMSSAGFDAPVAIKITPASAGSGADALAARRVSHPNVLQVIDRGVDEAGTSYLVAELVDGGTLAGEEVPWAAPKAVACVTKLARAVQAAHSAGVVHCDLKPSNILMTRSGEPKLADFDLSFSPVNRDQAQRGNLAFMAPEQFDAAENALAPAADVYGLGGLLYWLLSGRMPHGDSLEAIAAFHRERREVPPLSIERDLDAVVARALRRDRSERYDSAGALAVDLERWAQRLPIEWTHPGVVRRTRLLVARNPIRTALAVAGMLAVSAGSFILYDQTVGAQRREVATQARINETTKENLERLRAQLRFVVQGAAAALRTNASDGFERLLPSLFWLEEIRGRIIASAKGEIEAPPQRIESLQAMVEAAEGRGWGEHIDALIARYTLAGYLVQADRGLEAMRQVEWLEEHWAPRLAQGDIAALGLEAYRACAAAEIAVVEGSSLEEPLRALDRIEAKLHTDGRSFELPGMVQGVRRRIMDTTSKRSER